MFISSQIILMEIELELFAILEAKQKGTTECA
jgi:hypothetical protein